jgi:hypothetical protein
MSPAIDLIIASGLTGAIIGAILMSMMRIAKDN